MDKITLQIIDVMIDEIKKSSDIISGYHMNISLNGNINVKLVYRIPHKSSPSKDYILCTNIMLNHDIINCMAYPISYARDNIQTEINKFKKEIAKYD